MVISVSAQDPGADLRGCNSEALAGADGVRFYSAGRDRGVREDRVPVAGLLSSVEDKERPV